MASEEEINTLKRLQWQVAVMMRDLWLAAFEGSLARAVTLSKYRKGDKVNDLRNQRPRP